MSFVVKNTIGSWLADLICPYTCRQCGEQGEILCGRCKKYMLGRWCGICPVCKSILKHGEITCGKCRTECRAVMVGGWREGALAKLVKGYKYKSERAAGAVLVEILVVSVGRLENVLEERQEVVVVPLPTIGKHVRQRGLDHTWKLAKGLAARKGWKCEKVLVRKNDAVQVGVSATERQKQAEKAYEAVARKIRKDVIYLLLDDIWTTGASMKEAAKALKGAGVEEERIFGLVAATGRGNKRQQ